MKTFIQWEEKFNTGNFVVDHQHQQLIYLINLLENICLLDGHDEALFKVLVEELTQYTIYHFKTEEEIMNNSNYSGRVEHKILHSNFIAKLEKFKASADVDQNIINRDFCDFLRDWLLVHIASEDPKIIAEMAAGNGLV